MFASLHQMRVFCFCFIFIETFSLHFVDKASFDLTKIHLLLLPKYCRHAPPHPAWRHLKSKKTIYYSYIHIWMPRWVYVHHIHLRAGRGQKKVLDSLELHLRAVVNPCSSTENQTWSFARPVSTLNGAENIFKYIALHTMCEFYSFLKVNRAEI